MYGQITLFILLLCSISSFAETSVTIAEAERRKLISVQFTGAEADSVHPLLSSHWGACMQMEVKNNVSETLLMKLDYGYLLVPDDTSLQTMVVTESQMVKLSPGQKKKYQVYAMCTEAHDAAPSSAKKFKIGKRTSGHLLGITELIHKKKYHHGAGQNAVWCFTDNYDLSTIYHEDTSVMYTLRRYVAAAKNLPLASVYSDTKNNVSISQPTIRTRTVYSGSISYSVGNNTKVLLALFDEANHMKRVYVNNELQREGVYAYNYEISSDETSNSKHYLRLFKDGRMVQEISVNP